MQLMILAFNKHISDLNLYDSLDLLYCIRKFTTNGMKNNYYLFFQTNQFY